MTPDTVDPKDSISPKVTAAALTAAAVTLVIFAIESIFAIEVPSLVSGAITTLLSGAAGWAKTDPLRGDGAHRAEV